LPQQSLGKFPPEAVKPDLFWVDGGGLPRGHRGTETHRRHRVQRGGTKQGHERAVLAKLLGRQNRVSKKKEGSASNSGESLARRPRPGNIGRNARK